MPEKSERIIEHLVRAILERPQMHAISFDALEATLFALLTALVMIRGDDDPGLVHDGLRKASAQGLGSGSALSLSQRLVEIHGPSIYASSHPKHTEALGIYVAWAEKILSADKPPTKTPEG
jgi:hypothetical protein